MKLLQKFCEDVKLVFLNNVGKKEEKIWVNKLEVALSVGDIQEIESFIESFDKKLSDLILTSEKRKELFNKFYTIGIKKLEKMKKENKSNKDENHKIKQKYLLDRKERFLAIGFHQFNAFEKLIKNENDQDKIKELLYFSVKRGNKEIVDHLISKCFLTNEDVYYCLFKGMEKENIAGIKAMITLMHKREIPLVFSSGYTFKTRNGSDYSVKENTPLIHWAIVCKQPAIVELLIDKSGAELTYQNEAGENVLHLIATHWTKEKWVEEEPKELVDRSRDVYEKFRKKHIESTISSIVQKSPGIINVRKLNGATALMQAHIVGNEFAIQSLIEKKADAFIPANSVEENNDFSQKSPVWVRDLKKPVMEHRDDNGQTVLHRAAMLGHQDSVDKLLEFCNNNNINDLLAKDSNGQTAFCVAVQAGYEKIAEKIYKKMIALGGDQITKEEKEKMISALGQLTQIKEKADACIPTDRVEETKLHLAARQGHQEVVNNLLNHCNDIKDLLAQDTKGKTALCVAVQKGHGKIAKQIYKKMIALNGDQIEEKKEKRVFSALKQLIRYQWSREDAGVYQGLTWVNYRKDSYTRKEKCDAAKVLKKIMMKDGDQKSMTITLSHHAGALTQGRLGSITRKWMNAKFGKGAYADLVKSAKTKSDDRSLLLKKLDRYLEMRMNGGTYQGLTWFNRWKDSYTKQEKYAAAKVLEEVLDFGWKLKNDQAFKEKFVANENPMSRLHDHTGPLTQGRLGALARELTDNIFGEGAYEENIAQVEKQKKQHLRNEAAGPNQRPE